MTNIDSRVPLFPTDPKNLTNRALRDRVIALLDAMSVWVGPDRLRPGPGDAGSLSALVELRGRGRKRQPRHLDIAVHFRSVESIKQALGPPTATPTSDEVINPFQRTLAMLWAAQAIVLPPSGPVWTVAAGERDDATAKTSLPAMDREDDLVAQATWWTIRRQVWQQARRDPAPPPHVSLGYRYPIDELADLNLQGVAEKIAPLVVWCRAFIEEIERPQGPIHQILVELRDWETNPLRHVSAPPDGWDDEPADPLVEIEHELIRPFVEGLDRGPEVGKWPEIFRSHLVALARDPGIGMAGVAELAADLHRDE